MSREERFLLVAPLRREPTRILGARPLGGDRGSDRAESSFILVSKNSYLPQEIYQRWYSIQGDLPASVERAWIVEVKTSRLVVVECWASFQGGIESLEVALNAIVNDICATNQELSGARPLWVSRTLLISYSEADLCHPNWLGQGAVECNLDDGTEDGIIAFLSWGNNLLRGWDWSRERALQSEIAMGLVDAQFLWTEVSRIAKESAKIVHDVIGPRPRVKRAGFARHSLLLSTLSDDLALHYLNYDDLLLNIQGARRSVAIACLEAWGYHTIAERVAERLPMVQGVVDREMARLTRGYQGAVRTILLAVAMLAGIEFMLGLYSISITGTEISPSRHSLVLGLLSIVSPDILIFGGLVAIIGVLLVSGASKGESQ